MSSPPKLIETETEAYKLAEEVTKRLEGHILPPGYQGIIEVSQLGEEAEGEFLPGQWGLAIHIRTDFLGKTYGAFLRIVYNNPDMAMAVIDALRKHVDDIRDIVAVGGMARYRRYAKEKEAHRMWSEQGMPGPAPIAFIEEWRRAMKREGKRGKDLRRWFEPRDKKGRLTRRVKMTFHECEPYPLPASLRSRDA